jgi:hypothetical protein
MAEYSVAFRIPKLWGIVSHSIEKLKKKCGEMHLPYDILKRVHLFYFEAVLTAIVHSIMEIEIIIY